tara:strand:+ start:198 stop:734 length:537 start_codon:yes stop_codon:yes gene_type:complete
MSSPRPLTTSLPDFLENDSDDEFRSFMTQLFVASGRLQSLRRIISRALDLNSTQFSILLALWQLQEIEGVSIREVGDYLKISPANITAEVGKLVAEGLVDKKVDPEDSRAVKIRTTGRSELLMDQNAEFLSEINDQLFVGVTRDQFNTVHEFLHIFNRNSDDAMRIMSQREQVASAAE